MRARRGGPAAVVSHRRRSGVAQRHGRRSDRAVRDRSRADGLPGVRGRREAGGDLLQPVEPAHRAVAAARHQREHGRQAADGAGGGRRLRAQAPPARTWRRSWTSTAACRSRRRSRATSPDLETAIRKTVARRFDLAAQRDLHRAEGAEESAGAQQRGHPPPGHRRAVRRRRHLEPRELRRGARAGQAVRDRHLLDRPAQPRPRARARLVQRIGLRPAAAGAGDRREGATSRARRRSSPASTSRSPTSSRASTWSATARRTPNATAPGAASSSACSRPGATARTKQGYYGPTS